MRTSECKTFGTLDILSQTYIIKGEQSFKCVGDIAGCNLKNRQFTWAMFSWAEQYQVRVKGWIIPSQSFHGIYNTK